MKPGTSLRLRYRRLMPHLLVHQYKGLYGLIHECNEHAWSFPKVAMKVALDTRARGAAPLVSLLKPLKVTHNR